MNIFHISRHHDVITQGHLAGDLPDLADPRAAHHRAAGGGGGEEAGVRASDQL